MSRAKDVILYTRPDCHLCERAAAMVEECGVVCTPMDIDSDLDLIRQFGVRVPVIYRPDIRRELAWPFSPEGVREFLELEI